MCGRRITVPLAVRREAPIIALMVAAALAAVAFAFVVAWTSGRAAMPGVFVAWYAFRCVRKVGRAPDVPRWARLSMTALYLEAREIRLADVRSVEMRGTTLFVRSRGVEAALALGGLHASFRDAFVRHLEARVLLARGPIRCRHEAVALEAFHVLGAHVVRTRGRAFDAVLPPEGPWIARTPHDRIYARAPVRGASSPYRSAPPNVIVLEPLVPDHAR